MRHYILWISRQGCKDIYSVYADKEDAIKMRDELMKWCQRYGQRAYITVAVEGYEYIHKEMEED